MGDEKQVRRGSLVVTVFLILSVYSWFVPLLMHEVNGYSPDDVIDPMLWLPHIFILISPLFTAACAVLTGLTQWCWPKLQASGRLSYLAALCGVNYGVFLLATAVSYSFSFRFRFISGEPETSLTMLFGLLELYWIALLLGLALVLFVVKVLVASIRALGRRKLN